MEVAIVAAQQAIAQANVGMTFIKNNAQVEQTLANVVAQASNGRGQNLDITT